MKFTFRKGCKVREIAGENVVILQGNHVSDMTRIIALNESSLLLWNELYGKEFENGWTNCSSAALSSRANRTAVLVTQE